MSFEMRYSRLERVLHRLAFKTRPAQLALADMEEQLFKQQLAGIDVQRPVFITGLPRAGTTLLLELFVALDEFVSHRYRHMPFVLNPMLWQRFSQRFQQSGASMERAHGDGMMIDEDSPEALEEMLWLAFWPKAYRPDRIQPWGDRQDREFTDFLRKHMRKLLALNGAENARYISKNNLNIARLQQLPQWIADARVIVPFREPRQHVASLLRQHRNFQQIHRDDAFARDYMAGIGHFDFGANLRPVDFGGWLDRARYRDPAEPGFWLEYWVAAYEHILDESGDAVRLLGYDTLCRQPERGLERIADFVGIEDQPAFLAQAGRLQPAPEHTVVTTDIDTTLLRRANELYGELNHASLVN